MTYATVATPEMIVVTITVCTLALSAIVYELTAETRVSFTEKELADALREAASAHHLFEIDSGVPDEEWAGWYAKHMIEKEGERRAAFQSTLMYG